ncbi:MAG TPA: hypothetical protein VFD58_02505 [Blastocatellia bacterium]|nr:hypothetical protein [Blastocatellia bacterium]
MANEKLRRLFLEIVETQVKTGDPAIVRETLGRLMKNGHSRDESVRLIGTALAGEVYDVLKSHQPYDEERYTAALNSLE